MLSHSGRYSIVFNGEIYNHIELRALLEKSKQIIRWRGNSDTETLLAAFDAWGIEQTLKAIVGMFAIAVWDRPHKKLTLSRDRLGEKPLYYGWQGDTFIFSSELKSIKVHPSFKNKIDHEALKLYFDRGFIPAPHSIWTGIKKLLPGTYCEVSLGERNVSNEINTVAYWDLEKTCVPRLDEYAKYDEHDGEVEFEFLLKQSLDGQMRSDVPIGAFLSGGLDSSLVVAFMQRLSRKPINTFTIGFDIASYNEANTAKQVSKFLGTNHHELIVSQSDAWAVVPQLSSIYGEPFADSSAIPTLLVSKLASQSLKVALTGDGGDELFAGYPRYFNKKSTSIRNIKELLSPPLAKVLRKIIASTPSSSIDMLLNKLLKQFGIVYKGSISAKFQLIEALLSSDSMSEHYQAITKQWLISPLLDDIRRPKFRGDQIAGSSLIDVMMKMDLLSYLPDDILTKVDRAAMSVGLETRVPLLDHRIVEFAQCIPLNIKVKEGKTKWILRKLLYKHIPREIIDQPKKGFQLPLAEYLRGPLRDWAEDLLSESSIKKYGLLSPEIVQSHWMMHKSGQRNLENSIWSVLMLQSWLKDSM
jgi:asparagine synthase (glutamine-hydrolysing)